jgi:hypothetical protein
VSSKSCLCTRALQSSQVQGQILLNDWSVTTSAKALNFAMVGLTEMRHHFVVHLMPGDSSQECWTSSHIGMRRETQNSHKGRRYRPQAIVLVASVRDQLSLFSLIGNRRYNPELNGARTAVTRDVKRSRSRSRSKVEGQTTSICATRRLVRVLQPCRHRQGCPGRSLHAPARTAQALHSSRPCRCTTSDPSTFSFIQAAQQDVAADALPAAAAPRRSPRKRALQTHTDASESDLTDLEDLVFSPAKRTVTTTTRKRVQARPADGGADGAFAIAQTTRTRASASPVKRSPAKTHRAASGSPTKRRRVELVLPEGSPARWEETYAAIQSMRTRLVAPVDEMGCQMAGQGETDPKVSTRSLG